MRDPERIDAICSSLAEAWKKTPDQRLGQLITNMAPEIDPWHVEDTPPERKFGDDLPSWTERIAQWPPR